MVKMKTFNKDFVVVKEVEVEQAKMSGECWSIQFTGKEACQGCRYIHDDQCGGLNIRKTGHNSKGFEVPL